MDYPHYPTTMQKTYNNAKNHSQESHNKKPQPRIPQQKTTTSCKN